MIWGANIGRKPHRLPSDRRRFAQPHVVPVCALAAGHGDVKVQIARTGPQRALRAHHIFRTPSLIGQVSAFGVYLPDVFLRADKGLWSNEPRSAKIGLSAKNSLRSAWNAPSVEPSRRTKNRGKTTCNSKSPSRDPNGQSRWPACFVPGWHLAAIPLANRRSMERAPALARRLSSTAISTLARRSALRPTYSFVSKSQTAAELTSRAPSGARPEPTQNAATGYRPGCGVFRFDTFQTKDRTCSRKF